MNALSYSQVMSQTPPPATPPSAPDHRTRVGVERRERMRERLIEGALLVFAEKGVDASVIQDVVTAAGVSQGSFYNHFRSNEELLIAVSEALNNELMHLIEQQVGGMDNAAARIATGLRLYLNVAAEYPLLARFVARAGLHVGGPNNLIYAYLPPHIEAAQAAGQFAAMAALDMVVALDLLAGAMLSGIFRISTGESPADYSEALVAGILRGLGLPSDRADALVSLPLPPVLIEPQSLLARGQARQAMHDSAATELDAN